MSTTATDPLEGISEKSTKAEMLTALNKLADKLRSHEKQRTGRLAEIEDRVRTKYRPGDVPELHNVILVATIEEWADAIDFLENFEDLLPVALSRVRQGGRILLGPKDGEAVGA